VIVVDTNVLSEPLRSRPDTAVVDWLDQQQVETLFITALSVAELRLGAALLPPGRRRDRLMAALDTVVLPRFAGRVLVFDEAAAEVWAELQAGCRGAGRCIPVIDSLIAAICSARGFILATRNIRDFEGLGIELINPCSDAG